MQQRKNSIHHQHVAVAAVAAEDAAVVVADAMETAEATVPAAAKTKNWESNRCLELHFVLYH